MLPSIVPYVSTVTIDFWKLTNSSCPIEHSFGLLCSIILQSFEIKTKASFSSLDYYNGEPIFLVLRWRNFDRGQGKHSWFANTFWYAKADVFAFLPVCWLLYQALLFGF